MSSASTTFSSKPDQVLVVPPMAVAWLTEADCTKMLVSFEARGHSDATVLLSSHRTAGRLSPAVNYTVIIGSHRNSCVKIEKNGVVVCQVQTRGPSAGHVASPASSPTKSRPNELHPMQLDPSVFRAFWVSYGHGEIKVGFRDDRDAFCAWKDAVDVAGGGTSAGSASVNSGKGVENVRHVGLSCWNTHVGYRNVHVKTAVHVRSDMDRDGSDDSDGDHARMSVSVRLALDYLDDDAMERDEEFSSCPPSKIMNVVPLLVRFCRLSPVAVLSDGQHAFSRLDPITPTHLNNSGDVRGYHQALGDDRDGLRVFGRARPTDKPPTSLERGVCADSGALRGIRSDAH